MSLAHDASVAFNLLLPHAAVLLGSSPMLLYLRAFAERGAASCGVRHLPGTKNSASVRCDGTLCVAGL